MREMDCLFCKISQGEIPAEVVFTNDTVMAFKDIAPKAPVHVLVVPKKHVPSILELSPSDSVLHSALFEAIQQVVNQFRLNKTGFRVVANTGIDGGQTVDHLHFHILGGRSLSWPPG
jgi:histidine triad (HIT) family protein